MHELDIARKISKVIIEESEKLGFKRIDRVKIMAGRTQAIEPSQLHYFMKEESDVFKDSIVDVELVDIILECEKCKNCFGDDRFSNDHFAHEFSHAPYLYISPKCPKCGFESAKIVKGLELAIVSIDGE